MQNYTETLLSQYANSPTMMAIIEAMNDAIDPSVDIQNLYNNIWNVNTAVGYGLDVWGNIVGVSRNLLVPTSQVYFGFYEAYVPGYSVNPQPFDTYPFYNNESTTQIYTLGDEQFRELILAKAYANISNLSVPSVNKLLQILFMNTSSFYVAEGYVADGYIVENGYTQYAYIADGGNMEYTVVFNFNPTPVQLAILLNSGVFPRPCGVKINYEIN